MASATGGLHTFAIMNEDQLSARTRQNLNAETTNAAALDRQPRIGIVGAGVAGIATAVILQRAGFRDFTIYEKGDDVGGVWHWNRYPGLTCDLPSYLYQYSFALKPDWSRLFASREEIKDYHSEVVDRFALRRHLRLNSEITAAVFEGSTWRLSLADGTHSEVDFLILATGLLHHPYIPDLPGLESFTGDVVHSAHWSDSLTTAGKRIAVIGNGSTGVQLVTALQPEATRVLHFVRTPQWIVWIPANTRPLRAIGMALRVCPWLNRALHTAMLLTEDVLTDILIRPSWRRRLFEGLSRWTLRMQVRDRELRARLTPTYSAMCKRQVFSAGYYRAIQAPNADLMTEEVQQVTPTGIMTADGKHHNVDMIVLATGFRAHNYMRPMKLVGRDGLDINDAWTKGPRAYRTTALPGFPNLFTVLGPHSSTGSISLQYSSELTARYIAQWLQRFRVGEFETVEVTEEATNRFNDDVARALTSTVWTTGCRSWYLTDEGNVDLWPFDRKTMATMLEAPDPQDFNLSRGS